MIFSIIVVILAVVLDQVSKYLSVEYLMDIDTFPLIKDILHFTYLENRGAAFGMLANNRWVFMIASVGGILAIAGWMIVSKPKSRWVQCAMSLIIGGGIGNMIDRVRLGYVIDFIDCRFIDFYVFNIADSCVCVGCAMVILWVIAEEVKEHKAKKSAKAAETANEGKDE